MGRSAEFGSFSVEREFDSPVDRIWHAWSNEAAKREWFANQDGGFIAESTDYSLDFRVGGIEHWEARLSSGSTMVHETTYRDIVPNERIVAAYDVVINGRRISVSLWSLELTPTPNGTRLVRIEDGVFLDGLDTVGEREAGVTSDVEAAARYLERIPVA
jgi:uncharacterized protein YndB with AHSA1/START domain